MVQYRHLGNSGFKVSEITYGNWLTHASQIEDEQAIATVHAALDAGITTFDTADAYANTGAEQVLGRALKGQRREGLEILTKVYWPIGPRGANDVGLSRKHIREGIDGSLRRLGVEYVDLYQAHRYDYETPLEETMQAFADVVRSGKALYIGVSEWTSQQLRDAAHLARELHVPLVSNQPQNSMLWRVIEKKVVPVSESLGLSQIVWSPLAQGVLTGKYRPGAPAPAGSRAANAEGREELGDELMSDRVLNAVQNLVPIAARVGLTLPQLAIAWVLHNPNVASAIVGASRPEQITQNAVASGVKLDAEIISAIDAALGDVYVSDPERTSESSPRTRPAS
jgi:aryl-alcohol dehydrogenase-like predicted oxidoreductase